MPSHQNPQSFSRKAGDCPACRRLTKSQDQESIIINRPGRSTHPQEKSVLTSAATPLLPIVQFPRLTLVCFAGLVVPASSCSAAIEDP